MQLNMNEKPRGFEPRGFDTVISPLIVSASALYRQRKTLRAIARLIASSQTKKPRGSKPRGLAKSIALCFRDNAQLQRYALAVAWSLKRLPTARSGD